MPGGCSSKPYRPRQFYLLPPIQFSYPLVRNPPTGQMRTHAKWRIKSLDMTPQLLAGTIIRVIDMVMGQNPDVEGRNISQAAIGGRRIAFRPQWSAHRNRAT